MTTNEPTRSSGYRGALPPRDDRLARPWLIVVGLIFVLILVFAAVGIPSRFIPEPTPVPLPSFSLEPSASPSSTAAPSTSAQASASASAAASGSASASASPTEAP